MSARKPQGMVGERGYFDKHCKNDAKIDFQGVVLAGMACIVKKAALKATSVGIGFASANASAPHTDPHSNCRSLTIRTAGTEKEQGHELGLTNRRVRRYGMAAAPAACLNVHSRYDGELLY